MEQSKNIHPYLNLNIGIVQCYTLTVTNDQVNSWAEQGWVKIPKNPVYKPREEIGFTELMSRPHTLSESNMNDLIGVHTIGYSITLGLYGMGGPGFFGLLMEPMNGKRYSEYLVYCIWGSGQYVLLDGRVIHCSEKYKEIYHPWIASYKESPQEFLAIIMNARIDKASLQDRLFTLELSNKGSRHLVEFCDNDPRLPPNGLGKPLESKIESAIGDYLVFQHEKATLWV